MAANGIKTKFVWLKIKQQITTNFEIFIKQINKELRLRLNKTTYERRIMWYLICKHHKKISKVKVKKLGWVIFTIS